MKNNKNIIIGALIIVIALMAVGYATFATQLTIRGTAEITGVWNVKITNIEAQEVSEGADSGSPQYTNTSVTFDSKLSKPGDTITYVVTIKNEGTIDATLQGVTFTPDEINGSPAIIYTNTEPKESLSAGEETTFNIKVLYDPETTEIPSIKTKTITGIVEYVQK